MTKHTAVFLAINASYAHTNPAAWSLGNSACSVGWNWHIIEAFSREPVQPLLLEITKAKPDVLAASFFLFNREFLAAVLARYKILNPRCIIIGGGPELLGDNRVFLNKYPFIDIAIRGEGETALAELLKHWDKPEHRYEAPGICHLQAERYTDNGTAVPPDLETMPSPLPDDITDFKKPFLLFETSRGCSAQCVFCTSGAGQPPTRYFPMEYIRENLHRLQKADVPEIRLADRTFNENPTRAACLLRMFREEFTRMRFHLEIDPGRLTDGLMAEFAAAQAGQLYLEVGVQTLTEEVFQRLGRRGRLEDCRERTRQLCQMHHLRVHTDLIAGLPGGTPANLLTDLDSLVNMQPAVIQLEILKLLPGTALAVNPASAGIYAAPTPPYEVLSTETMTLEDMETARQLCRMVDWFYNTPALQKTTSTAAMRIQDFWLKMADICRGRARICDAPSLNNRFKFLELCIAKPVAK